MCFAIAKVSSTDKLIIGLEHTQCGNVVCCGSIASKAFPGKNADGSSRWRYFNLDVTDVVFKTHLFYTLSTISLLLSGLAELIFFQTVLLEVSYNCYLEDPAQKCFEFFSTIYPLLRPWDESIDCDKAVHEKVPVTCYIGLGSI